MTGGGRYADDVNLDGQLWSSVLRSPHAHAAIAGIDCGEARATPGVHLVLTATDLEAEGIGSLPFAGAVTNRDGSPIAAIPPPGSGDRQGPTCRRTGGFRGGGVA